MMRVIRSSGVSVAVLLVSCTLSFAGVAEAHTTGASLNETSGPYTVDLGYNPIAIEARDYATFDFLLWKGPANTGEPADYAQVWIRVLKGKETLLATGVMHQAYGPTTLLYTFPDEGTYSIEASYRKANGDEIAAATFPMKVLPPSDEMPFVQYIVAVASALAGAALGFGIGRSLRRKELAA